MTHRMTVNYHQPADTAAFDDHYASTHAPLAKRIPGLRTFDTLRPDPQPDGSPAPYYLIATLTFDDAEAFGAAVVSEEGTAAVADLDNFASGGVTIVSGAVEPVA